MITRTRLIGFLAHIKVIMTYGAENVYPLFTLFTAVGVAKIAFEIPAWVAAIIMTIIVFGFGLLTFKVGLLSQDLEIKWQKTPSAKELCDRVKRIERQLNEERDKKNLR